MRTWIGTLGLCLSCALFAACDQSEESSDASKLTELFQQSRSCLERVERPSLSKEKLADLRRGNVDLSFRLLESVANQERNAAISGVSLQTTLGMTHAMAAGDTQKNIAESIGFLPKAEENYAGLNYFSQALQARNAPKTELRGALELTQVNELFFRKDMKPGNGFLDLLAQNFGAGVSMVDFSKDAPAVLEKINRWIDSQTKGMIPKFLSSEDVRDDSQWLAVNALYLKAPWAMDYNAPKPRPFTTAKGERIEHPAFKENSMFAQCGKDEDARWAYLPTRSEELTLLVILPEQGKLKDLLKKLDGARLEAMAKASELRGFIFELPQFSVDTGQMDLSDAFKAQGMTAPFEHDADFRGYSDGRENTTPLARVLHQVVISADRKGISAGAATTFEGQTSGIPDLDYSMVLNQPFLFAVIDEPTGLALFVGQVVDPRG